MRLGRGYNEVGGAALALIRFDRTNGDGDYDVNRLPGVARW